MQASDIFFKGTRTVVQRLLASSVVSDDLHLTTLLAYTVSVLSKGGYGSPYLPQCRNTASTNPFDDDEEEPAESPPETTPQSSPDSSQQCFTTGDNRFINIHLLAPNVKRNLHGRGGERVHQALTPLTAIFPNTHFRIHIVDWEEAPVEEYNAETHGELDEHIKIAKGSASLISPTFTASSPANPVEVSQESQGNGSLDTNASPSALVPMGGQTSSSAEANTVTSSDLTISPTLSLSIHCEPYSSHLCARLPAPHAVIALRPDVHTDMTWLSLLAGMSAVGAPVFFACDDTVQCASVVRAMQAMGTPRAAAPLRPDALAALPAKWHALFAALTLAPTPVWPAVGEDPAFSVFAWIPQDWNMPPQK